MTINLRSAIDTLLDTVGAQEGDKRWEEGNNVFWNTLQGSSNNSVDDAVHAVLDAMSFTNQAIRQVALTYFYKALIGESSPTQHKSTESILGKMARKARSNAEQLAAKEPKSTKKEVSE